MTEPTIAEFMQECASKAIEMTRNETGNPLDYSEESIDRLEKILDGFHRKYSKTKPSQSRIDTTVMVFGGYLGEVIRRHIGGEWRDETSLYPGKMTTLHIQGSDIFPPTKVYKRLVNGAEDNVADYYWFLKMKYSQHRAFAILNPTRITQLQNTLMRKASRMIVGGFRPLKDPSASWFGRVNMALPNEAWPQYEGDPMWPLCQINCSELPYTPDTLQDVAFICVFILPDATPYGKNNGEGWLLRAYSKQDKSKLIPLQEPSHESHIRPFPVRWELLEEDYPSWEDMGPFLTENELEDELDIWEILPFKNKAFSKIGGWPTHVQHGIFQGIDHTFVFQIETEPKAHWMWHDRGIGYFALDQKSSPPVWMMDSQSL